MLLFIGFAIVWVIGWMVVGMIINSVRVSDGANVTDADTVSSFIQGFALGPIAIMAAFSPVQSAKGKTAPLLIGGLIGSYIAYSIFTNL